MPLTSAPLSPRHDAGLPSWLAELRSCSVLRATRSAGALRWTPTQVVKLTKKTAEESREKTIIKQEEERPASGTTYSPLALDQSLALGRICSPLTCSRRADPRS